MDISFHTEKSYMNKGKRIHPHLGVRADDYRFHASKN